MSPLRGSLLVLAAGLVFSFGGLAFRATDDIGAWPYLVFRGIGAFVVAVIVLAVRHWSDPRRLVRSVQPSHLLIGALIGSMSILFIVLLEYVTVAFVLFLQTLAPLAAAWFSWWFLRERVSRAVLVATAVAMVGVGVMVSGTINSDISPVGVLAIAIPALFGLYATLLRKSPDIDPQVPVLIAGLTMVVAGVLASLVIGGFDVSTRDALIGLFAGSALLGAPVIVLNRGAVAVPAPETALLLMIEIIAAPVWVWLFADETPGATTLIGGAIMVVSVVGLLIWRRNQANLSGAARLHRRPA